MPKSRKRAKAPAASNVAVPQGPHTPVMLAEVLHALGPNDGAHYIDATFGAGGYTRAILEAADCRVTAFDRDPSAIAAGQALVEQFAPRLTLVPARFSTLLEWAEDEPATHARAYDGVVFDLGVSSMQLDRPERGFSFQTDGPLDMRMSAADGDVSPGDHSPTAADLLNTLEADEIANILYDYGEERRSRAIARAIVKARETEPFATTRQLVDVVTRVLGPARDGKSPATRTFQALRIAVNQEFDELVEGLAGAERLLKLGGKLIIVTFHSIEDRIVKRFLNERAGKAETVSRHLPEPVKLQTPSLISVYQKPLTPGNQEIAANPRARSAKLRAAERLDGEAWPLEPAKLGVPGRRDR